MEGLAKYDLEAVMHVELKIDFFCAKSCSDWKGFFFIIFFNSRSAVYLYPCLRSWVFFHLCVLLVCSWFCSRYNF